MSDPHTHRSPATCEMNPATSQILRAVIMGPPGAGKGTISSRIVAMFDLHHLSSGDLLRSQITKQTSLGQEAQRYTDSGILVPDHTMVELILSELKEVRNPYWLLDGFPRTVPQAEALLKQEKIDMVINLDVPFQTIIDRIRERWIHPPSGRVYNESYNPPRVPGKDDVTGEPLVQRPDDHPDTVSERLRQYEMQTKPVLDFYHMKGLLKNFTGSESDKIWPEVKHYIKTELGNGNIK